MTRTRYRIYEHESPDFLTNTSVAWLPIFTQPAYADIILESWRYLQRECGVRIFDSVILENRLHWIAVAEDLSERDGPFKSYTARRIIDDQRRWVCATLLVRLSPVRRLMSPVAPGRIA